MNFARYLAVVRRAYLAVELAPPELNRPASEEALAALERALGHALPAGLRKAWLVADGQGSSPDAPLFWQTEDDDDGRLVGHAFLSVEQALAAHAGHLIRRADAAADRAPRDSRIADGAFHQGWLPFADPGSGSARLILDLAPSPMGAVGQVIAFTDEPLRATWVAASFDALLATSFAALESDPAYVLQEVSQDGPIAGRRERRDDRE